MDFCLDPPDRLDLSFRDNDDGTVLLNWIAGPNKTPVPMTAASLSLAFDLPKPAFDEDGVPLPRDPEVHVITSTASPGDPNGWIDADPLGCGQVLTHIPHAVWAAYTTHTGVWDAIAIADAEADGNPQKCLARGMFVTEAGVSPPIGTPAPAAGYGAGPYGSGPYGDPS